MDKFGSLSAKVEKPFRVILLDPATDLPLKDKDGKEAYIDVLSAQSDAGRKFDRERQTQMARRAMRSRNQVLDEDAFEINTAKTAALTVGWYLVDPSNGEPIDAAFSMEAALEFYRLPLAHPFFMQAFVAAHETANFIKSSSTT